MNYLYSLIGAFLMAFAVGNVLEPMQLVTGGVSGLAIILKEYSAGWFPRGTLFEEGIPLWVTSILLNIPLFVFAYRKKGSAFVRNSLWGAGWLTFFLGVIPDFALLPKDYVLNTLFGGLLEGIGIGLVLRSKASTGGSDLLATLLHDLFPYYSIPRIMAVIEGIIILFGFMAFGIENGLYALIVISIVSAISDRVITGFGHTLVAYIISDYSDVIAKKIMEEVKRGITGIQVQGLYQQKNRIMLMCAANKRQIVLIKEIVAKYDWNAFVIVVDAREALGEGFQAIGNNTR